MKQKQVDKRNTLFGSKCVLNQLDMYSAFITMAKGGNEEERIRWNKIAKIAHKMFLTRNFTYFW